MLRSLATAELPLPLPMTLDFPVDARVMGFSLAASLAAGLLFGLAPALHATRTAVASTLRDETAGGGRGGRSRLRSVLVIAQVAVSVVLLVGAGLFLRSLQSVYALDPGFGRHPASTMWVTVPASDYTDEEGRQLITELEESFARIPGVQDVGVISNLHLNQVNTRTFGVVIDGVEPPPGQDAHRVDWAIADPSFFRAAGVPIINGRGFRTDDRADALPVTIVSEAFAETFWPGKDPLGKIVRSSSSGDEFTVVGVAGDTKVRSLGEPPRAFLYLPVSQSWESVMWFVARTETDPRATIASQFAVLREIVPAATVFQTRTMDEHLDVVRFPAQITAALFVVFAGLAFTLAIIGLYGLVSYTQAQRIREVGIRLSLGADARSVVWLLVRSGLRLAIVGAAIGLTAALGLARLVSGLLYDVPPQDPATFVSVIIVLAVTALVAAWVPARRASRVEPAQALRAE